MLNAMARGFMEGLGELWQHVTTPEPISPIVIVIACMVMFFAGIGCGKDE